MLAIVSIIFSSFYNNKKEEKRTQLVLNQVEQRVVYAMYYGLLWIIMGYYGLLVIMGYELLLFILSCLQLCLPFLSFSFPLAPLCLTTFALFLP